ncbi:hypothetical protein [Mycobacterium sp. Aquia_213]|uniref:hypothetical protein n=1 Tax=Mycobacterium sp. Aquia_213 TaxID=2991728 RepID=UPI00226F98F7|nr:hypothetical protein [Mycobacterium sp. Aquia_213]WAC91827.1 hypothetical protein LMQ14_00930 [Mycobacterium sp. Aquia_213]
MDIKALIQRAAATAAVSAVLTGGAVFTCGTASANGALEALERVIQEYRPLVAPILSEGGHIPVSPVAAESVVTRTRNIIASTVRSEDTYDSWMSYWNAGCKVNKRAHKIFSFEQALQDYHIFGYDRERTLNISDSIEKMRSDGQLGTDYANAICQYVAG